MIKWNSFLHGPKCYVVYKDEQSSFNGCQGRAFVVTADEAIVVVEDEAIVVAEKEAFAVAEEEATFVVEGEAMVVVEHDAIDVVEDDAVVVVDDEAMVVIKKNQFCGDMNTVVVIFYKNKINSCLFHKDLQLFGKFPRTSRDLCGSRRET